MAKKVKPFADQFQDFVESLFDDGSIERWEVDTKIKKVKSLERKTSRRLREQRIIRECLGALQKQ